MSSDHSKISLCEKVVELPSSKTMRMSDALICLRVTRETLRNWRNDRQFPQTFMDCGTGHLVTDAVADWLSDRDVVVVRK
jgi:hypothetical protein